jgi:hypothetical protein
MVDGNAAVVVEEAQQRLKNFNMPGLNHPSKLYSPNPSPDPRACRSSKIHNPPIMNKLRDE